MQQKVNPQVGIWVGDGRNSKIKRMHFPEERSSISWLDIHRIIVCGDNFLFSSMRNLYSLNIRFINYNLYNSWFVWGVERVYLFILLSFYFIFIFTEKLLCLRMNQISPEKQNQQEIYRGHMCKFIIRNWLMVAWSQRSSTIYYLQGRNLGKLVVWFGPGLMSLRTSSWECKSQSESRRRWDISAEVLKQERKQDLPSVPIQALNGLDNTHPNWGGQSIWLNPLISHPETPIQTHPKVMFKSGHPVTC